MKSHDSFTASPINEISAHDVLILSPPPPKLLAQDNPWLSLSEASSSKIAKRANEVVLSKNSSLSQKSEMALKKKMAKTTAPREKEGDDAVLEISIDNVMLMKNDKPITESKGKKKDEKPKIKATTKSIDHVSSDDNSELDDQEAALQNRRKGPKAFEQRELVARAFAGDNVVKVRFKVRRAIII